MPTQMPIDLSCIRDTNASGKDWSLALFMESAYMDVFSPTASALAMKNNYLQKGTLHGDLFFQVQFENYIHYTTLDHRFHPCFQTKNTGIFVYSGNKISKYLKVGGKNQRLIFKTYSYSNSFLTKYAPYLCTSHIAIFFFPGTARRVRQLPSTNHVDHVSIH